MCIAKLWKITSYLAEQKLNRRFCSVLYLTKMIIINSFNRYLVITHYIPGSIGGSRP